MKSNIFCLVRQQCLGTPTAAHGSRNSIEISPELHGSGVDLHGSEVDLGIALESDRNFMELGWISMDLGWISDLHMNFSGISWIRGGSPSIWGEFSNFIEIS